MTLAKAEARANQTFMVHASLKIVTYDRQNIVMVQATDKASNGSTEVEHSPRHLKAEASSLSVSSGDG
jgi:hypothetical protein